MPSNEIGSERKQSDEVSKKDASGSGQALAAQKSNSVFDFLYHDARRIAAFLAQFETYGVLEKIRATEATGRTESTKDGLTGGFTLAVAKAGKAQEVVTGSEDRDSAERTYDPLWTNARRFQDYLVDRKILVRDLKQARIGQFVLTIGTLAIADLAVVRQMWNRPAIRKMMLDAAKKSQVDVSLSVPANTNRAQRKALERQMQAQQQAETEAGFELVELIPHTIQATLRAADCTIWSSLREDSLVIPSADILLKHGISLAGQWAMLGIVDALPHRDLESGMGNEMSDWILEQKLAALTMGAVGGQAIGELAPIARLMLGRPASSYGMTPLLIFREVSS